MPNLMGRPEPILTFRGFLSQGWLMTFLYRLVRNVLAGTNTLAFCLFLSQSKPLGPHSHLTFFITYEWDHNIILHPAKEACQGQTL